ncbi:MAG: T9SS type A sorting domain-containing protein [Endomicrobiales bacterium]|nr:T9SS type A sorting domain-containing protein [Endomicrobiales bacterium]
MIKFFKNKLYFALFATLLLTLLNGNIGYCTEVGIITSLEEHRYDSGLEDRAYAIAVNSDECIYVTGYSSLSAAGIYDFYTIKYSSSFVILSSASYNSGGNDYSRDIVIDSSGNVIVTGAIYPYTNNATGADYFTIKYDSNLNVLSSATFRNAGVADYAFRVTYDAMGNIIVGGKTLLYGDEDMLIIKYDPNLQMISSATYDGGDLDGIYGVGVDSEGNIYSAGYRVNPSNSDCFIIKYDCNLQPLTSTYYDSGNKDTFRNLTIDNEDYIIATGETNNGLDSDYLLIKYNSDLTIVSSATWDSDADDNSFGVCADDSNNIFITGYTFGAISYDCYTIKYNSDLELLASSRYNYGLSDYGMETAIGPSGNIYVTGYSDNGANYDMFVIKYSDKITEIPAEAIIITIIFPFGRIEIRIPYGTFSETVHITVRIPPFWPSVLKKWLHSTDIGAEVTVSNPNLQQEKDAEITITYNDSYVTGLNKNKLILGYYDDEDQNWVMIDNSNSLSNENKITAATRNLNRTFRVFQLDNYGLELSTITSIIPNSSYNYKDQLINVTITGNYILDGSDIKLTRIGENDIEAQDITITSNTVTCSFNLLEKPTGYWNIAISSTVDSTEFLSSLSNGFEIRSFSTSKIEPNYGYIGTNASIQISGTSFASGSLIKLTRTNKTDIEATNINVSSNIVTCSFNLQNKTQGLWNLEITTNTVTGIFANSFIITQAASVFNTTPQASGIVDKNGGLIIVDNMESPIYNTKLDIPSGAINNNISSVNISINSCISAPKLPQNLARVGNVVDLSPSGMEFEQEVTLSLPYKNSDLIDYDITSPEVLKIYYYDTADAQWIELTRDSIDTVNRLISVKISHFSLYALGSEIVSRIEDVEIYPNPFKSTIHTTITFSVPLGAEVKIFTLSGELIKELSDSNETGKILWDATNSANNRLSSGVYICRITKGSSSVIKKLAIIK